MVEKQTETEKKSQAPKIVFIILAIIVVGLLVVYFIMTPYLTPIVALGDCVNVKYIAKFTNNGTVFASSYIDVVNKTGGEPVKFFINPYANKTLPIGYDEYYNPMTTGFTKTLVGMKEGETKTVVIQPEDAFGIWNTSTAQEVGIGSYPINSVLNMTVTVNATSFLVEFPGVEPFLGTTFDYGEQVLGFKGVLNATVINISFTNITYRFHPQNGTQFLLPIFNWNVTFIVTNDTAFTLHSDVKLNHTFSINETVETLHFKVVAVNDTKATLAVNVGAPDISYIGQSILYEVKVDKVYKTSQH